MFRRLRTSLVAGLGVALVLLAPAARASADDDALIRRAFVYSFPVHEMGRLLLARGRAESAPLQFTHRRNLATPADRTVTTPNNDTLYSSAWLNLARGPVKLTVPETQGRYYSVALVDAVTDDFATIGRRTTGTRPGEFIIVGPDWVSPLPDGARVIRAPGNDVFVLLRLLVDGPADLAQARRLQDGFKLSGLGSEIEQPERAASAAASATAPASSAAVAPPQAAPPQAAPSPAERYLAVVNRMLARNPPPSYERALLEQLGAVGVCAAACSWDALPPALQARWNALLPELMADLQRRARAGEQVINGWTWSRPAIGNFGTAYELRAQVALSGLLALEPAEALYMTAREDAAHRALEGTHAYRLHLPPAAIPVDAFWSLTMYEKDQDGRLFLVSNPNGRYAIGDRTPGLRRNRDGSIDLWIQRADPGGSRAANWLPASRGPFVLTLRAYQPRIELRDARSVVPPVERVE
jgi:hypothetical protein